MLYPYGIVELFSNCRIPDVKYKINIGQKALLNCITYRGSEKEGAYVIHR